MKIDESIKNILNINTCEIIKQFKSRQNEVYLINADTARGKKHFVYKHHNKSGAIKEKNILNELYKKGVKVPKVLCSNKNIIIMEYLNGDTLIDRIEYLEEKNLLGEKEISQIISFFYKFYKALKDRIHWDINFSNFIIHEDSIWGVDFEDVKKGEKETDFGRFFAFLMTYSPSFTEWKLEFLRRLYIAAKEYFDIDKQKVKQAMTDEFLRMQTRRHIAILQVDIQKIVF